MPSRRCALAAAKDSAGKRAPTSTSIALVAAIVGDGLGPGRKITDHGISYPGGGPSDQLRFH